MTTIDFSQIRSAPKSRNDCFEALAVLLFRRSCSTPSGSTFVSLRGDGGDGGVEAYFRTPSGSVIGVQAKYFFELGASEMGQIDKSLETAVTNHPTLAEYWIYIPFDLTGRVAGGRRGKSQAERFEEWKHAVESDAVARGASLTIVLCTASVISGQLLALDPSGGMRRYWFDNATLTTSQIRLCLDEAMAFAGPRYCSELDVVTNAHEGLDFFGGIGDFDIWRKTTMAPPLAELRSLQGWGDKALNIIGESQAATTRTLIKQALDVCASINGVAGSSTPVAEAICALSSLLPLLAEIRRLQEEDFYKKHGQENDTPSFRQFHAEYMCDFPAGEMDAARNWEEAAEHLHGALTSQEMGAATTRSLLLIGPAGIGKTHAIVSAASRRLANGGVSLVVFGDDFGKAEPWEVLRSKLGFSAAVSRATLFECLQACAEHTGLPFVIYIDALNESPRNARWKDKLPELLAQCKPYEDIKVCVSARDTYRHLVVDARFPGFAFEHAGFTGQEFEAVEAFASYYGLDSEITPLFTPELSNPLFLHLACKTLRDEGRRALDVSLPGFTALFESHLKHCDSLVRGRIHYSNPRNLVRAAMMRLAEVLTQNLPQERTWDVCTSTLKGLVGSEIAPEALLSELEHEGLVILTEETSDTWLVRLGYQRYGDILRASNLIESVTLPSGLNVPELAKKLAVLSSEDDGLLEALAAVLPEKTGGELTQKGLGLEPEMAHRLFINALPWRSRTSVTDDVIKHVFGALATPGLWWQVYEVFFRLSLVPDHRLNAANWLSPFLLESTLANRDAYLSLAAFESYDSNGAVQSLLKAALLADVERWPKESLRLAALTLAWLTSCADRRVRDLASKGLTRIIAIQPNLGRVLTDKFRQCDDDYILESVSLAIYSACLLERGRMEEFVPAFEGLLSPTFNLPNILVRDSVRLLGELLMNAGLAKGVAKQLKAYPKRVSFPKKWPTLTDAKPLLGLEHLPSNMKLWGSQIGPDFWRYQVESKIHDFDLDSAGVSYENIACWIMVNTVALGYPGKNECALRADRHISSKFGTGRGRKAYADRLGKKYYWVSLHRLIGILADHVSPASKRFSDRRPSNDHLWSVDVRKVDLTDVRDISPLREYPDELVQTPLSVFPTPGMNIKNWVRTDDFPLHDSCVIRTSPSGDEWVALSLSARADDRPPGEKSWSELYLGVSLYYTSAVVDGAVPKFGRTGAGRDFFDGQGASCYRGYLAEYPDGQVFEQCASEGDFYRGTKRMQFSEVTLSRGAEWEYDFSYMTPERQGSLTVPSQSIVQLLGLKWDRQRGWIDSAGELISFSVEEGRQSGLFIRRMALNSYLESSGKQLVYRRFANRGDFKPFGDDGSQIDLFTWLLYRKDGGPVVLHEDTSPFNC
jgi:hypothetical protein